VDFGLVVAATFASIFGAQLKKSMSFLWLGVLARIGLACGVDLAVPVCMRGGRGESTAAVADRYFLGSVCWLGVFPGSVRWWRWRTVGVGHHRGWRLFRVARMGVGEGDVVVVVLWYLGRVLHVTPVAVGSQVLISRAIVRWRLLRSLKYAYNL